jgi:hypothetical protein
VLEGVAGERGVVGLDVELEVFFEAVGAEEGDAAGDVEVVLVLGGLLRLGLDEELALEADALGVIDGHVEKRGEVVLFAFQVGVEEGLVAFAAAPEDVVFTAELLRDLEGFLHLGGGVGEDVGVGVGRGAAHVAGIREEVGGAPEEFHAGGFLELLRVGDDGVEVFVRLRERAALGGDVAVVEGPERGADFLEELEAGFESGLGDGDGVFAGLPRADDGAGAEGIGTGAAEGVPVGDREAHVLREGFAVDDLIGVEMAKREGVGGAGAFVGDGGDAGPVGAGGAGFFAHGIWV